MRHALFLVATLIPLGSTVLAADQPYMTGTKFMAALQREVAGHQDIMGPYYSYQEWEELLDKSAQPAVQAAKDPDSEQYLWDQAHKALKEMKVFSKAVASARTTPLLEAQKDQVDRLLSDILNKMKLGSDEDLHKIYADRLSMAGQQRQAKAIANRAAENHQAVAAQSREGVSRAQNFARSDTSRSFDQSAERRDLSQREQPSARKEEFAEARTVKEGDGVQLGRNKKGSDDTNSYAYSNEQQKERIAKGGGKVPDIPTERAVAFERGFNGNGPPMDEPRKVLLTGGAISGAGLGVIVVGAIVAAPVAVPTAVVVAGGALVAAGIGYVVTQMPDGGWGKL